MSHIITKEELQTVKDIYAEGGEFAEKLRAKCNWEHMIPVAVLREGWFKKELADFKKRHNKETI